MMYILILFGPPGAGKGTQAVRIARKFGWIHISSGDILRAEVSRGTPLGIQVKDLLEAGKLVSDELLISIVESVFLKHIEAAGIIFDGFPRTLNQASGLDDLLKRHNKKVNKVLTLEVDENELIQRLLKRAMEQGRNDDTESVIRQRLVIYHQHTKPLIDYYKERGLLSEIRGAGGIEDIFKTLCGYIDHETLE